MAINIACSSNVPSCLTQTKEQLKNFVESGVPIAPDLAGVIFCNGIKTSSEHIFFKLHEVYSSSSKSLKNTILNSLACTQNTTLLKSHLSFAIENSLAKDQILQIFTFVDHGKPTLNVLIEFVRENYNKLASMEVLLPVCAEIASQISDLELSDSFLSLLKYLELKGIISKLNLESFQKLANFIDWQKANLRTIQIFLEDQDQTTSIITEITFPTSKPILSTPSVGDVAQTSSLLLLSVLTVLSIFKLNLI